MKLPLLEQTQQLPERIPMRTGYGTSLASAQDLAVSTAGLPRALPQPESFLPADYGQQSLQALTRLAATGTQLGAQTTDLLLEAAARARVVDTATKGDVLVNEASRAMDRGIEAIKATATHDDIHAQYFQLKAQVFQGAMGRAGDLGPAIQAYVAKKLDGLDTVTAREINTAWREKYQHFQIGAFNENRLTQVDLATKATTPEAYQWHLDQLEGLYAKESRKGTIPADTLVAERQKDLSQITMDRAKQTAFLAPMTLIDRVSQGDPEFAKLKASEQTSLLDYAESRIRTLRSDQENADAQERRVTKAKQDDVALGWRQRIAENYRAGGPGVDLLAAINADARNLGEGNHAQILEMHKVYQDRFLKPTVQKSDPATVGDVTYAFRTGDLAKYTQADLLRLFTNAQLDEGDYDRLTALRDTKLNELKATAKQGETESEKLRKEQIKDAEKTIDEVLKRGSRYLGDPKSQSADILIQDATNELHRRLAADPKADPDEVATQVIARRVAQAETLAKTLPYKSKEEVQAAYQAGLLDKRTASRYYAIFDALGKSPAKGTEAAPAPLPPAPGLLDRFKNFFGPSPESPAGRTPVKPGG